MKPVRKVTNKYPFSVTICRIGSFWWGSKILNVENTTETFVTVLRQALPSWNNTRALIGRLYWARSAPENRSRSVIGPKPERNVVLCSAAVCGGGAQGVATTETAARRLPNNKLASASATVLRGTETQVAICNLKPRGGHLWRHSLIWKYFAAVMVPWSCFLCNGLEWSQSSPTKHFAHWATRRDWSELWSRWPRRRRWEDGAK